MTTRDTSTHIAISTWGVARGALATVAAGLAKGFTELGCAVDVVRVDSEHPSDFLGFPADVRHFCLDRRSLTSFLPLARYLRSYRPDVLICIGWMQNPAGVIVKALCRYRGTLLLSEHATLSYEALVEHRSDPILRRMVWFARHFYRLADAVVAVSEEVRSDLESIGVARSLPLVVIPNPVDLDRIRRQASEPCCGSASQAGECRPLFVS